MIASNALAASGEKAGQIDPEIENGMAVDDCCARIIRAIETGKDEIVIGKGLSGIAPLIKRLTPGLLNRIMAKRELTI